MRREVIEKQDDEIKAKSRALDVFLVVEDAGFGEKRFARLRFEASVTELRGNDIEATFSMIADNMRLTFLVAIGQIRK